MSETTKPIFIRHYRLNSDMNRQKDAMELVCHILRHTAIDDDLRPYSTPCCYIGDDDLDIEEQLPPLSQTIHGDRLSDDDFRSMDFGNSSESQPINRRSNQDRSALGVDEGIGSELTSVSGGFGMSPPILTPQTSMEPSAYGSEQGATVERKRRSLEKSGEKIDTIGVEQVARVRQQPSDDENTIRTIRRKAVAKEDESSSPEAAPSPVMSSYDWPMTTTEKLMNNYGYKNELSQFTRRMDNIFPLFSSGQRETVRQGLRALHQLVEEGWKVPENSFDVVNGICVHLQKSGQLDFIIQLFVDDQFALRNEAGQVLDVYLSEETCVLLLQNNYIKDIVNTIISACEVKDAESIKLSLSLLESLFRSGADTCKAVVEQGGLDFVLEVCKVHLEVVYCTSSCRATQVDTRLHAAVALANLAMFGSFETRQMMVRKQVPAWLFVLLTNDDIRVKYYACLCLCMMASNKEFERDVQNSGTLNLVTAFLKSCRPEQLAKSDSKYRYGRSSQFLNALSPLLMSTLPEVLGLAMFQFAMEAYLRRGSARIDVFEELRLVPRIQEIASVPGYDLASKFAAKILTLIGERVPYKLSQAAPLWPVKDVQYWVRKIGFSEYADTFVKHRVDGDLLLQTKDEHLRNEIGMKSAYERLRFMRELNSLKRSADYSAVDRTRLDVWLMRLDIEFSIYTYQMLLSGVDRSTLIHLDDHMLRDVCGIENSVHRLKLMYAIREVKHVEELDLALLRKQVDIFICYRRSTGSQLASLLKVHLQLRGFKVFIDVDRLYAGQFDKSLLMNIRAAKHFILVLTPRALDPCIGDDGCKDWVHLEIQTALNANANIVPVQEKGFEWPPTQHLPADIQRICGYNAIQWVHEYQEACVDKLHRFLTGQASLEPNAVSPPVTA